MEYLGTIYKGSQSDIIFPVPFIELSDGATVDFYTDGDGGFSRTKDEIKIDNYMLKTTASADELNSLNDGVLNYTINTCMGKSEGDTGLYLSKPSSYVDKQYLTADGVKTINGESIVGQGNIEIQGGGSEDYVWEWTKDEVLFTTNTNIININTHFDLETIKKVLEAYKNGENIVIKTYDYYTLYPYTIFYTNLQRLILLFTRDDFYYSLIVNFNNNSENITGIASQRLFRERYLINSTATSINCHSITTKGHGNLDTAITVEGDARKKVDDDLQSQINSVTGHTSEQDKRIDTIESYAKESLGNLDALSGSVVNNYYTKTQCDKQYEVIGYSYSKKEVDGKIPTSTSQLTNDSGYLTEHQSLEEYYTKGETYSKSEIDTKIGDINNILETI